ncbi:glycosyltransferase [Acetobacter indonesiensis]|uniref:glycosyltransferase n=1 Tax=Acetobacter indonesiensis TaxID=104101 RepID=UPI0020A2D9EA|nr:glycosyltransferase [Acetobacter indonesiensis]MCP1229763.1 glycosyltransferase [Acetobacter indonesiensis]
MRVLVWQWGRRGAGPKIAVELAKGINALPGQEAFLSLSSHAEIVRAETPTIQNDIPVETYTSLPGLVWRAVTGYGLVRSVVRAVRRIGPTVAICAMPGPLDLLMVFALRRAGVPVVVVVHDAQAHPGDGFPGQMVLQRLLVRSAECVVALTQHVAKILAQQPCMRGRSAIVAYHPPFAFDAEESAAWQPPLAHEGPMRLLVFGRLLPYKGLDLLADALTQVKGQQVAFDCHVVGRGPDAPWLEKLAAVPGVTVENRWVPEGEIARLLAWADVLLLPYREASQSGVGAAALAAGRWVLATNVGGLTEQFGRNPQARMCAPTVAGLSDAVTQFILSPPPRPVIDTQTTVEDEWATMAAALLSDVSAQLGRPTVKPVPQTKS